MHVGFTVSEQRSLVIKSSTPPPPKDHKGERQAHGLHVNTTTDQWDGEEWEGAGDVLRVQGRRDGRGLKLTGASDIL